MRVAVTSGVHVTAHTDAAGSGSTGTRARWCWVWRCWSVADHRSLSHFTCSGDSLLDCFFSWAPVASDLTSTLLIVQKIPREHCAMVITKEKYKSDTAWINELEKWVKRKLMPHERERRVTYSNDERRHESKGLLWETRDTRVHSIKYFESLLTAGERKRERERERRTANGQSFSMHGASWTDFCCSTATMISCPVSETPWVSESLSH